MPQPQYRPTDLLLAIDQGGQSTRVAIYSAEGQQVCCYSAACATTHAAHVSDSLCFSATRIDTFRRCCRGLPFAESTSTLLALAIIWCPRCVCPKVSARPAVWRRYCHVESSQKNFSVKSRIFNQGQPVTQRF